MKAHMFAIAAATFVCMIDGPSALAQGRATQNYSNTTINNESGKPLPLITVGKSDGTRVAELVITGKRMSFGDNQRPFEGAGYVQAFPGQSYSITMVPTCTNPKTQQEMRKMLLLRVKRIEWDDQGRTINLRGLDSVIKTSLEEEWKIISDTDRPTVKGGAVSISLKDKGDFEFAISFGGFGTQFGGDIRRNACRLFDPATHPTG